MNATLQCIHLLHQPPTCRVAHPLVPIHPHTHTPMHTLPHTHAHIHVHTHSHTHTHTPTHTHTYLHTGNLLKAREAGFSWTVAKCFDGACPTGEFVHKHVVKDVNDLDLWLKIDGVTRQRGILL